jgi:archaemetzincin
MKAVGSLDDLPQELRKAFTPAADFKPIPLPGPNDWLSIHHEAGQSFSEYTRSSPLAPPRRRKVIYLQPVGEFHEKKSPSIDALEAFGEAFFCMEVSVLSPISLKEHTLTTRVHPYTRKRQILALDILSLLLQNPPFDAYCILAVTMEDLYPDPSWNFVFGQALIGQRVGVFSFARYDPAFYKQQRAFGSERILLHRSCKVLAHETCHMFGILHCIHYHCLMNGSNHLEESDRRPLHLCPVCLRKLYHALEFDIKNRYLILLHFYEREGFHEEAGWIKRRLRHISE